MKNEKNRIFQLEDQYTGWPWGEKGLGFFKELEDEYN